MSRTKGKYKIKCGEKDNNKEENNKFIIDNKLRKCSSKDNDKDNKKLKDNNEKEKKKIKGKSKGKNRNRNQKCKSGKSNGKNKKLDICKENNPRMYKRKNINTKKMIISTMWHMIMRENKNKMKAKAKNHSQNHNQNHNQSQKYVIEKCIVWNKRNNRNCTVLNYSGKKHIKCHDLIQEYLDMTKDSRKKKYKK